MSGSRLWEVTRWEFLRWFKIKDQLRALLWSTLIGLLVWGGVALFKHLEDADAPAVVVFGHESLPFDLEAVDGIALELAGDRTPDEALAALEARDIDAVLTLAGPDSAELKVTREPTWRGELDRVLTETRRRMKLEASPLEPAQLADLLAPVAVEVTYQAGATPTTASDKIAAGVILMLMVMGVFVGLSYQFIVITGEKQLRVTELIVSAISPQTWIDGKILGISLLAFASTCTYMLSGLIFVVLSKVFGVGIPLPPVAASPGFWLALALLAVAGFLFWTTFFGLIASTIDDPNTSARGAFLMLPGLPLLPAFLGFSNPDALMMRVLALFPPTAPAVLTVRLTLVEVPWWEVVLALLLLVATTWLLRRAAGKVFALAILMYGKEPTWGEMARWIRET